MPIPTAYVWRTQGRLPHGVRLRSDPAAGPNADSADELAAKLAEIDARTE